jgi:hypothetical protein
MRQHERWRTMAWWWRSIAACAIALTLGLGQAYAEIENAHEGGQGRDKEHSSVDSKDRSNGASEVQASAAIPQAEVTPPEDVTAPDEATAPEEATTPDDVTAPGDATVPDDVTDVAASAGDQPSTDAVADIAADEDGAGVTTRTRTTTRSFVKDGFVVSRTRSRTIAYHEDGNRAVARAVAKARAPDDVAAVENGAGRVVAKTSVDVTGNGAASADAGGSIGVNDGKVEVSTWGRTSAEVF